MFEAVEENNVNNIATSSRKMHRILEDEERKDVCEAADSDEEDDGHEAEEED